MADDGAKPQGTVQFQPGVITDPTLTDPTLTDPVPSIMPTLTEESAAAPPVASAPPDVPAWRYEIMVEIARGGMGRVVEAKDTVLGRTVALKEALARDPDAIKRFERETRITARLEHPSIVPVHDAGTTPNGAPFYVMRKIGGRPLEDLVGQRGALAERLALLPNIVASAQALAHAHARGVVHRDVKPSNILVGDLGETILIDWGLAKALGEPELERSESDLRTGELPASRSTERGNVFPRSAPLAEPRQASVYEDDSDLIKTRAGVVFGTPGFMAPEQLRGAPADERCDVYALGATLYHLLARRPPHYAKTAGEMMVAAAKGPAPSVRERVPGVPPELAAIVDKALAFDREERYRDARALADDLQHFISGQLVAAHHYSPREKLARWIRKNRTAVAVGAAAAVALLAGGTFAVSRIVAARDREHAAAEHARAEQARAEQASAIAVANLDALQLADARDRSTDAPSRAVAMVKPLVPLGWQKARDIAAAARASGVAFALPASPHALSLELSRDGDLALAAGDDGVVRIYDLAKRTVRVIADAKAPTPARFGAGEHTIVLFRDNHLTLVDVATGTRRDVMTPTPIARLEVSGPIAYWTDAHAALWRLDLAGTQPEKIATDEPISAVHPSPDGRWVALIGSQHVFMLDRTAAGAAPQPVTAATGIHAVQWSADASHAALATDDELIDIAIEDATPFVAHRFSAKVRDVAWSRSAMFATSPAGISLMRREMTERDDHEVRVRAADCTLGIAAAWNDALVAGRPGALSIVSDDGDRTIASPLHLERIAASPRGPFVVGAAEGELLVWQLDDVLPRHPSDDSPTGAGFATADAVVASFDGAPAQWIDLRTNEATPLAELAPIAQVVASPDGQHAVVIDTAQHARVVAQLGDPTELPGAVTAARFLDARRLALATASGVVLVELGHLGPSPRPLAGAGTATVALATSTTDGGWIAAAFANGALWRGNLHEGTGDTLALGAAPARGALALGGDGEVIVGTGAELRAWRPDGSQTLLWTARHPIQTVAYVDHLHVLVVLADGASVIADTRVPNHITPLQLELPAPVLAGAAGLAATLTPAGTLELADPSAGEHWQLAPRAAGGRSLGNLALSPDGRRVLAIAGRNLLAWAPALPDGEAATARWLDALTNARVDHGAAAPLDWK